jgi:hypothetical protein
MQIHIKNERKRCCFVSGQSNAVASSRLGEAISTEKREKK